MCGAGALVRARRLGDSDDRGRLWLHMICVTGNCGLEHGHMLTCQSQDALPPPFSLPLLHPCPLWGSLNTKYRAEAPDCTSTLRNLTLDAAAASRCSPSRRTARAVSLCETSRCIAAPSSRRLIENRASELFYSSFLVTRVCLHTVQGVQLLFINCFHVSIIDDVFHQPRRSFILPSRRAPLARRIKKGSTAA